MPSSWSGRLRVGNAPGARPPRTGHVHDLGTPHLAAEAAADKAQELGAAMPWNNGSNSSAAAAFSRSSRLRRVHQHEQRLRCVPSLEQCRPSTVPSSAPTTSLAGTRMFLFSGRDSIALKK
ncbi:hypothetical protein ZWY2020_044822 [Hordeum vulgare]|nr:hypothetical protein ZWY2020_044822 [Hordeum vulgare]